MEGGGYKGVAKGRIAILLNTKYIVAAPFSMASRAVQRVFGNGFGWLLKLVA